MQLLLQTRHHASKLKLFARKPAKSLLLGETRSRFRGRGMEFEEVRHYQPSDDIRSIDWRVSARTGKTYTKLFSEERERPVYLIVDQRTTMFFGSQQRFKSVMAAEIASYLAWSALNSSDRIGAQVFSDYQAFDVRARRNRQAVLKLLHNIQYCNELLPLKPDKNNSQKHKLILSDILEQTRRIVRPGSSIFIISDCHDIHQGAIKHLRLLRQHNDVNIIHVNDPLELAFPTDISAQSALISDGEANLDITINRTMVNHYNQLQDEFMQELNDICKRHRISLINSSCVEDPFDILYRIYN